MGVLEELGSTWDISRYAEPHGPAEIETVAAQTPFGVDHEIYVEDLPIKFPGTDVRVPDVLAPFGRVIDQLIAVERRINPGLDPFFVYLTIDQKHVTAGRSHRPPGVHVDGFQKHAIKPQIIQHQLAVTNVAPTEFYVQPFDVEKLRVPKKQFFASLAEQVTRSSIVRPAPFVIHILNPYCVHGPGVPTEDGFRTFVRMSVSPIPFMGRDNTRNELFDYTWNEAAKADFYGSIQK